MGGYKNWLHGKGFFEDLAVEHEVTEETVYQAWQDQIDTGLLEMLQESGIAYTYWAESFVCLGIDLNMFDLQAMPEGVPLHMFMALEQLGVQSIDSDKDDVLWRELRDTLQIASMTVLPGLVAFYRQPWYSGGVPDFMRPLCQHVELPAPARERAHI